VSLGSSGLKAVVVATGDHDVYLQAGRAGMRWDACSSDALVRAAGGLYTETSGASIDYRAADLANRAGLLATNGRIHAQVVRALSG
jgi:3'(2'), 5'-bisphosphate nucleotidase